jgi:hypothetical protein
MSVIAIQIEPHRTTRVFFDCSDAAADLQELAIGFLLIALENPQGVPDIVAEESDNAERH